MRLTALLTVLLLALAACGGDEPAGPAADAPTATEASTAPADDGADDEEATADRPAQDEGDDQVEDEAADDDAAGGDDPAVADIEVAAGLVLRIAGSEVTGDIDDAQAWSCATSGDGGFASVGLLDEAGNDISIGYDVNAGTTATLTLADGTNWNLADGGAVEVDQDADGVYRMALEMVETDTEETALAQVALNC